MDTAVNAARWAIGKALAPVTDGLLESWAASTKLGANIDDLKMELLYAQGMLENAQGKDIRSAALKQLLYKLRQLAYVADDALDELEYFRIQDEIDGTNNAADVHAQGFVQGLVLNAHHTAQDFASKIKFPSCSRDASHDDLDDQKDDAKKGCLPGICCSWHGNGTRSSPTHQGDQDADNRCMPKVTSIPQNAAHAIGKRLTCCSLPSSRFLRCSWPSKAQRRDRIAQSPKLQFDRVEMSKRISNIIEQLKPICAKVSTILDKELLGSAIMELQLLDRVSRPITQANAMNRVNRPETTPQIIENELYGRDVQKNEIVDGIVRADHAELTVLPIVGPGGIGKTTFVQHIYREVQSHFDVLIWICVSLNFSTNKLTQEILKKIPEINNESKNASDHERIEQRLKGKRFLLVVDDMWTYHEDEWNNLLAPLRNTGVKGNMVIVTTRIQEVAKNVQTISCSVQLERLGDEDFKNFFIACVFGNQQSWEAHSELNDVGNEIIIKLKGFPLAAKTVGRLLRNQLTLDHWVRVLGSKEWELQSGDNDIMPALKLSYDYLPFQLQQCFSYCSLFPEDYEFDSKELVYLWLGLGILHSCDQNKTIEDVGLCHLNDLVSHGFFKKNIKEDGPPCYITHDLLHNLAVKVSSYECLSISSSNVRSIHIPPSIRHLSIIVDDRDVQDIANFEAYKKDLGALDKRLELQNMRTLLLLGQYHGNFVKTFGTLFREARALRAIFLSDASYSLDDLLQNFSKLVHLRYLRVTSVNKEDLHLSSAMPRFFHLEIFDLEKWQGSFDLEIDMSNLVKLRHFVVPEDELHLHSDISEVGKLKFLLELRRFQVQKGTKGFELSQLGPLTELGGSLGIHNLERVQAKEAAKEQILIHKSHLRRLILEWDISRSVGDSLEEERVLDYLVPHTNLQDLCISGHGGTNCPKWLGANLCLKSLESLRLHNISWKNLPPLGGLWLVDELNKEYRGCASGHSFQNLKTIELVKIPRLKMWVGCADLFSHLEVLIIEDCSELVELPFSHPACFEPGQGRNTTWFPKLAEIKIMDCPKLLSLPPIPWTRSLCNAVIKRAGSHFEEINYEKRLYLRVKGKGDLDSHLWNAFSVHNLNNLEELEMENCSALPLNCLQMLTSLKVLTVSGSGNVLLPAEGGCHIKCPLPIETIQISMCGADGKELTQLLSLCPKLTELNIDVCENVTGLGVMEQQPTATPASASGMEHAQSRGSHKQSSGEDEIAAGGGRGRGLLLLPPQLQKLRIQLYENLSLHCNSTGDDNAGGGVGLQVLLSLRSLAVWHCPMFLSSCSHGYFPLPSCVQKLDLRRVKCLETLEPFTNLTNLTSLYIDSCGDLRGKGIWTLLAQGRLTDLTVKGTPKFFTDSEPPRTHEGEPISSSSKHLHLWTDDVAGVLAAPICSLLSSSLARLVIAETRELERFSTSLQLLTSLPELMIFGCMNLQRLPSGLDRLTSLKKLDIWFCGIESISKHSLPSSLEELDIYNCVAITSLPKEGLPSSLQRLRISRCPAIKSLPKEGLPSSLLVLDVQPGNSEELMRQCHKLKGTIPIVKDYS